MVIGRMEEKEMKQNSLFSPDLKEKKTINTSSLLMYFVCFKTFQEGKQKDKITMTEEV